MRPIQLFLFLSLLYRGSLKPVPEDDSWGDDFDDDWDDFGEPVPEENIETMFHLFSRQHSETIPYNATFRQFDPRLPTKVIIHGFRSHCAVAWAADMRAAFLAAENCQVVCLDWGVGAGVELTDIGQAAANTRTVAGQLVELVKRQGRVAGQDFAQQLHLVGHSLGAQLAGLAGKQLPGLARISGLDPARPVFDRKPTEQRLHKTDAEFVDVIHTSFAFGLQSALGDVDFYPAGGLQQPGCEEENYLLAPGCSHARAYQLYTASILAGADCRFPALPCCGGGGGPAGEMGYHAQQAPGRGSLYLNTTSNFPFCFASSKTTTASTPPISTTTTTTATTTTIEMEWENYYLWLVVLVLVTSGVVLLAVCCCRTTQDSQQECRGRIYEQFREQLKSKYKDHRTERLPGRPEVLQPILK